MFSTERGSDIPNIKINSRISTSGKITIVEGGINLNTATKIPKIIISRVSMIREVKLALIGGISFGM